MYRYRDCDPHGVVVSLGCSPSCTRHFELADEVCAFCGNLYVVEAETPASLGGKEEDAASRGDDRDAAAVVQVVAHRDERPPPSPIVTPASAIGTASPLKLKP